MNSLASMMLSMALVLAGLPHLFCNCGCVEVGEIQAAEPLPSCPYCSTAKPAAPSQNPNPCDCPDCGFVVAVAGHVSTTLDAPAARTAWLVDGISFNALPAGAPARIVATLPGGLRPPALSNRPSAALPLLLGHLLL